MNWGVLPGGGASKSVVDLMPMREAMYHALMGAGGAEYVDSTRGRQEAMRRFLDDKSFQRRLGTYDKDR